MNAGSSTGPVPSKQRWRLDRHVEHGTAIGDTKYRVLSRASIGFSRRRMDGASGVSSRRTDMGFVSGSWSILGEYNYLVAKVALVVVGVVRIST